MANHPKPSGSDSFGTWNMYYGDSSIVSQSQGAEDNVIEESMASGFLQKVPLYNLCRCSSLIVDAQGSDSTINESCSGRVPVFITYTSSSLSVNPLYGYSSLVYELNIKHVQCEILYYKLVRVRHISNVLAMELCLSGTNPSIWC